MSDNEYPKISDENRAILHRILDRCIETGRKFRSDYSFDELALRFKFEEKRTAAGLKNSPHSKEFRSSWNETLKQFRTGQIDLKNF